MRKVIVPLSFMVFAISCNQSPTTAVVTDSRTENPGIKDDSIGVIATIIGPVTPDDSLYFTRQPRMEYGKFAYIKPQWVYRLTKAQAENLPDSIVVYLHMIHQKIDSPETLIYSTPTRSKQNAFIREYAAEIDLDVAPAEDDD